MRIHSQRSSLSRLGIATVILGISSVGFVIAPAWLPLNQAVNLRFGCASVIVFVFGSAVSHILTTRLIMKSMNMMAEELTQVAASGDYKKRIQAIGGIAGPLVLEINHLLKTTDDNNERIVEMTDIIYQREQENQVLWLEIEHNLCLAKEDAERDGLTNLYNRKCVDQRFEYELEKAKHAGYPVSALMADLDHFKHVNDTYGHQVGDEVLKIFAETLWHSVRVDDIAARYGGEEFIVVLPNTAIEDAMHVASRINAEFTKAVERELSDVDGLSCTVSIGVADCPAHAQTKDDLVAAADAALFDAKEHGRNRVVYYGDMHPDQSALHNKKSA